MPIVCLVAISITNMPEATLGAMQLLEPHMDEDGDDLEWERELKRKKENGESDDCCSDVNDIIWNLGLDDTQRKHISKRTAQLKKNIMMHIKSKDRVAKLKEECKLIVDHERTPTGVAPFKSRYESEFLESKITEPYTINLTIAAGSTIREAQRKNYLLYLANCKLLDIEVEERKLASIRPHLSFDSYVQDCSVRMMSVEDFIDLDIDIPHEFLQPPPKNEVKSMIMPLYQKLLQSIKKARVDEQKLKAKDAKAKNDVKDAAARLNPKDVIAGAVRQVMQEDRLNNGKGRGIPKKKEGEYEVDFLSKLEDTMRCPDESQPSDEHIQRRRLTKAEINAKKKQKNEKSQSSRTLGTAKTRQVDGPSKGKSEKGKPDKGKGKTEKGKGKWTKGAGKDKSKKGKGKGDTTKGNGKGKGGKWPGKDAKAKGKGKKSKVGPY